MIASLRVKRLATTHSNTYQIKIEWTTLEKNYISQLLSVPKQRRANSKNQIFYKQFREIRNFQMFQVQTVLFFLVPPLQLPHNDMRRRVYAISRPRALVMHAIIKKNILFVTHQIISRGRCTSYLRNFI